MSEAALHLRDLHKSYDGRSLLQGLELRLDSGQRVAVSGASGAGKTTLLRVIAGLEDADAGALEIAGRAAMQGGRQLLPPWRRGVQVVFQDLGLWPTRSVFDNVHDALRAQGVARTEAQQRCQRVLEALGLNGLEKRKPAHLSGGEGRRLALARALAVEPAVLLLDEPFTSLDPDSRADGFALLDQVLDSTRAAVVLVTHDPVEAGLLGGDALQLRDGGLHS